MKIKNIKKNKGFVLLYTILVTSLILLFALGISNTSYKETILSSSARDAGYSFFAADSGVECALLLINKPGISPCLGFSTIGEILIFDPSDQRFNLDNKYCFNVTAVNNRTAIEVRGYNVPCDQKDSPRSVERALRISGLTF